MKRLRQILAVLFACCWLALTTHPYVFDNHEASVVFALGDPIPVKQNYRSMSAGVHNRSITALKSTDEAIVEFRTFEEFGVRSYMLEISHDEHGHLAVRLRTREGREPTLRLSDPDQAGLDRLLDVYRFSLQGTCSSQEFIQIRWLERGKMVGHETYVDCSCKTEEVERVVTISEIISRLHAS